MVNATAILTMAGGLLALLFGMFTIVARDRKAPYVTNKLLGVFVVTIISILLVLSSYAIQAYSTKLLLASFVLLFAAVILSVIQIYQVYMRFNYFVNEFKFKQLPGIRHVRRLLARFSNRPRYEHTPLPFPEGFVARIFKLLGDAVVRQRVDDDWRSLAVKANFIGEGEGILVELCFEFLSKGLSVQYMTASRHPIEFVNRLEGKIKSENRDFAEFSNKFVAIDAYTAHFGFLDSIYPEKSKDLESLGVKCVSASMSYAGVHSAGSRAFNVLKEQDAGNKRSPTLVIYEDAFALSDLESSEQYRVFIRHVLPSERQFDGMFTVVVESTIDQSNWQLLRAYADLVLERHASASEGGAKLGN
jgi:hypothetical protein